MGATKDRMVQDLELKGYSPRTQEEYVRCATKFVAHFMRPPSTLTRDEVRSYFVAMVEAGDSAAKRKMHAASVKFLYEVTLEMPELVVGLPYPKVQVPVPNILDGTEVRALLDVMADDRLRVAVMTAYSSGLRVGEVCALQVDDIDSKRMVIRVRSGKGGRGRYTVLSLLLLSTLREYWRVDRPPRPYLFPCRFNATRPMSPYALRKALHRAAADAGLTKRVTPHTLRHTFATHMMAMGADIRQIQIVLGHRSIQTTARYTHMTTRHIGAVGSPLDIVVTDRGAMLG